MFGDQYSYCFLIDLSKLNIQCKFGRHLLHNEAI